YSGVAAALRGQSGNDDTAAQALSAYAPAGWAHWAVVAQVSRSTALSGLYLLQRSVVLIAGTLGLINLGSVVVLQGALRRRSNAEDAHKRTSEYARSLLEASLDPLVTISAEGKITDVNEAAAKVTGVQRATLVGTDFSDYFTEPDKARAGYRRVFAQGSVVDYPLTVCARDGHLTPVLYNASLYRDTEGKVAGVFAAARDVTAQRQASQYARSLLEASLDPLVTISAEGKITDVNEAAAKVTGVQRATLVGTDFSDYFTEPDKARAGYRRVFAEGSVVDYPLTIRARDGHLTHVLYNASVYRDIDGKVAGVFAAARDVTAQRRASQYARSLLEASLDPLVTINAEGRITDVNEATIKVTGCDRTSLIGTNFSQYFTEPDKAQAGYQRVFAEGAVVDYPLTIRHRDGRLTPVLYNASLFRDTDGKVAGVFAAARDVTAQRRAEAAIRELNRTLEQRVTERTAELEASNKELEAFTYSVSHDLRAPLRAMAGFANLLNQKQAPTLTDEGQQYLRRIDANATKMGALIDELLKFSRLGRSAMQIGRVDMTAAATAAFSELRDQAEAGGVEVTVSPLPAAQGDAALMHQVFANLIGNAIKFSRGRPGAKVEISSHVDKGETVYDVRDNGVGFDMRYADKLFGVFQRLHSQAQYEGTGVGLALVQRIIHRHGGRVWAEAALDKGAAFHFTLKGD
ncbi:MAG TPA: PAS domain S-box protein, partial [Candidatus Udaeobacter sp.]|nr:PAS domain S-box protein [Candidatus Udaeobacter sp.]